MKSKKRKQNQKKQQQNRQLKDLTEEARASAKAMSSVSGGTYKVTQAPSHGTVVINDDGNF